MVRFEKDKFIVEVHTGCNPTENWLDTMHDLIDVLSRENPDMRNEVHYQTLWLLRSMLPEWEDAKKMVEE